jgi:hypothetical protein
VAKEFALIHPYAGIRLKSWEFRENSFLQRRTLAGGGRQDISFDDEVL